MLTGDLAQLGRIASSVASLADVTSRAAPLVSERLEKLVLLEFDAGVDPYGVPWADLAPATTARGRHAPPLTDTRQLRESLLVYPSHGVRMSIGTPTHPAGPHQDGWTGPQGSGPARPIFPTGEMPLAWDMAIRDSVIETIEITLGRTA